MAEVQEPDLGTITTLSDSEHLRALNSAGESVKIAKSNLKLLLSQIYSPGYAETLDNLLSDKMDLSTLKSQMAFIDAFGQVIGAGVNRSVLSTPLELDAFFSGFATITGTLTDAVIGDIYCVQAWDNSEFGTTARTRANQIICSSRGVWYRVWSTTWDDYIYVGGSYDSLSLTRAQAITLIDNGKLTMGVSYRITDNGNDEGIILEAISNTTFSRMGVRMSLFPKEYAPVTEGGRVWRGQWASILTNDNVDIGNFFIYNSRVWQNKTGNIGTVSGYGLDSTNWDLVEVVSGDFYEVVECQCEYDIRNRRDPATSAIYTKGWVFTMTDDYGNTFGSKVYDVADELSLVEYNMFHCPYVYNNTLKGCSNIRNRMGEVDNYIANNSGIGSIYNLVEVKITDTIINGRMFYLKDGSISNLVQQDSLCTIKGDYYSHTTYGSSFTITKTTMANGATIIVEYSTEFSYDYPGLNMTSCFVYGEVRGWATYLRTTFGTGYSCPYLLKATDSVLNGSMEGVCWNAENVYIGAGAQISFAYVELHDVYIGEGRTYTGGGAVLSNLFIPSSAIYDGYGDGLKQTALVSKIAGEIERVGGSLSIPTGATFQAPTYTGTENEVRLNGMTYASGVFTVQHEGWYKVEYIVCANLGGIAGSIDIETAIFVGSTQTNISRKVTYQNNSQWKNEYITGQVYLYVGDSVDVRYKNTGATITATTYTARLILTYNN